MWSQKISCVVKSELIWFTACILSHLSLGWIKVREQILDSTPREATRLFIRHDVRAGNTHTHISFILVNTVESIIVLQTVTSPLQKIHSKIFDCERFSSLEIAIVHVHYFTSVVYLRLLRQSVRKEDNIRKKQHKLVTVRVIVVWVCVHLCSVVEKKGRLVRVRSGWEQRGFVALNQSPLGVSLWARQEEPAVLGGRD